MICWIATARRTFVCFSPASRSPRSANTFPELRTTDSLFLDTLFRPFAISRLVVLACHSATSSGTRAARKAHARTSPYTRPVSIAAMVRDNFQDARPFAFPRLRFRVLAAKLRHAEGGSYFVLHGLGKLHEVVLRRADPKQRLFTGNALRSD